MEEFLSTFEGEFKDGKASCRCWFRFLSVLRAVVKNNGQFVVLTDSCFLFSSKVFPV